MSPPTGAGTWPEQNAVDAWWQKHGMELKKAVTAYRIAEADKNTNLREALEEIARRCDRRPGDDHSMTVTWVQNRAHDALAECELMARAIY